MSGTALLTGFAADLVFADPRRGHPVAGFGRVAAALERRVYAPSRLRGALVTAALVAGTAATVRALAARHRDATLAVVTWATLGGNSLRREALGVAELVQRRELDGARRRLPALCGRDAAQLDGAGLARAIVESVAENTSDAVVGALLWGAVAGPAGAAAYRAANTLDAMFGHHDERYEDFGWASARLDDALSWPAARLSAALTCLSAPVVGGSPRRALRVLVRDGASHPSPNAGRVEAAFAGALGLTLGGELSYAGRVEPRPRLGDGRPPAAGDVRRATRLSLAVGTASAVVAAGVAAVMAR